MDPNEQPSTPDAPDQETMEQIRRRRVAKLGAAIATSSSPNPQTSESPAATIVSSENQEPPASTSTASTAAASETASAKPEEGSSTSLGVPESAAPSAPSTDITGSVGNSSRKRRATTEIDNASAAAAPPRKHVGKEESLEIWTDRTLNHIFRVTVDPSQEEDSHGHKLTFLPELSQEMVDEGAVPKLSLDNLDQAIVEAATAFPRDKALLDYFLPCWKRVVRSLKVLRGPAPQKEAVLKEAKRLCFSDAILALTTPELFGRDPNPLHDNLMPYLLRSLDHEHGICIDFYTEAVSRFGEDESIEPLFTKAMVDMSSKLSTLTMNDDYKPYVNALMAYSKFPPLLNALANHTCFQMSQSAPGIEKHTLLGPFFRISPLQTEVTKIYFAGPRTLDKSRIQNAQSALQITLTAHQSDLKLITNAFVRASIGTRNKVLDWLAYIMNVNHKRRAMRVDPKEVSSDGFMMNVTVVLDFLCEPFMDSTFSKVDRIDVDYFRRNPRIDIKDETKLNADQAQSDAFYAKKVEGASNFITEVFFLTLAAHHYGSEATNTKLKNLDKDIKFYEKHIATMEAERPNFLSRPDQMKLFEDSLRRHTDVLEKSMSLKYAIEGVLLDEKMQGRSLQFMRYVSVWVLRIASQTPYTPESQLKLPLPVIQPEAFSCLPEYALQDVVDNFKFVFRYVPQIILSAVGNEMIALCITFLESSEYVRNPYLKSSLVSMLFSGTWPTFHLKKGVLGDLLTSDRFAETYLLHAIMKFYIECESTGAHTQFYDKFNIRYEIFQVIKCVWTNDHYKRQLTQASKTDRAFFVRFVNLLMNDATYVLDEGLSKFPKIRELTEQLEDPSLPQQDRQKKEEELHAAEGQAQSYMQLANETVAMMKLFTSALSEAFTMPEIVVRLAGMLDYNMDILTGPKSRDIKVKNPEKYHFNPRTLMPELVDIYINLGTSQAFIEAVAADGRSYKPETFQATTRILRGKFLKNPADIQAWEELCNKFAAAKEALDQAEMDFGEVPSDFEDPIMGDLMKDPVILPSTQVVDRSTIIQHLLSDQTDPFTRRPMTIDDVVPDLDLKEKIEAWKAARIAEAHAIAAGGHASGDAMDTTE